MSTAGRIGVLRSSAVEVEELVALGVYDPAESHSGLRLELLNYLIDLGATREELVTFKDTLPALAGVLAIRGPTALTLEQVAERSGMSPTEVRSLARTAGIPDPEPDVPIFAEVFATFASSMADVSRVFGDDASAQLVRVFGLAMSRIADAVISSFLVNVAPAAQLEDPIGLGVARANVESSLLLSTVPSMLDALLRQHLLIARRLTDSDTSLVDFEIRQLVVGFVDLVGSTELGEVLDLSELGTVLNDFEHIATETITEGGGRVVKLIGDEIMYTAPDALSAASIAIDLTDAFDDHPTIPQVRAGLASGEVMMRDGDVFGPVVNLASRMVNLAHPGEVISSYEVAASAALPHEPFGAHRLGGIPGAVELYRLIRN
jgi:adenylate cyclase